MAPLRYAANFDPFLCLDCAKSVGGRGGAIQGKEGVKFCRLATLSQEAAVHGHGPVLLPNHRHGGARPPDKRDEHLPLCQGRKQPARRLHPLRILECDAGALFSAVVSFYGNYEVSQCREKH